MRFTFIQMEKAVYSLCTLCRVMQVSRSGYYKWLGRTRSARAIRNAELTTKIRAIHNHSNKTYGSPRIHAELREEGTPISRKRVARIMRQESIAGVPRKRYRHTTDSNHKYAIASNLLNRTFDVKTPNTVWSCDITHVWTWEGWLYLAVVMDLFSRRVVGWAAAHHMRTELVLNAFDMAVARRSPADGIIHHSDRGSQYASSAYQRALTPYGMVCSMSRKGNCWDNAVVESFFGTLKTEVINRQSWTTRKSAKEAIIDYIEFFYNTHRRHSHLGYISPNAYERSFALDPSLAA